MHYSCQDDGLLSFSVPGPVPGPVPGWLWDRALGAQVYAERMRPGRRRLVQGVALAVLALLAACAPPAAPAPAVPTPGVGAQAVSAREPVTVIKLGMVSASWSSQLPVAIAQDLGFFRDEGVAIEPQTVPSGGPVLVAMLLSGEIEMMTSGIEAQLASIEAGAPVVIVGGMSDKSDYSLLGARGLHSVDDLRGQIVAVTGAGTYSEFAVTEALRRQGLERERDYAMRAVGNTSVRLAALSAGQVQAVPLDPGDRFRAMDEGFPVLLELGKVIPEFPFSTLAASKALVAAKPNRIVGVLRALARAQDYIREDLDRAVELGKAHGLGGEAEVQRKALAYVADDLHVSLKRENLAALLIARGQSTTTDTVFDDAFLRQAGLAP